MTTVAAILPPVYSRTGRRGEVGRRPRATWLPSDRAGDQTWPFVTVGPVLVHCPPRPGLSSQGGHRVGAPHCFFPGRVAPGEGAGGRMGGRRVLPAVLPTCEMIVSAWAGQRAARGLRCPLWSLPCWSLGWDLTWCPGKVGGGGSEFTFP